MKRFFFFIILLIALLPNFIFQLSSAFAEVIKKDFIVIYWNKIGFTDHSVVLNKIRYPAGTKIFIIRYGTSSSGERIVVIRAISGAPETYPLKHFLGGYESLGYVVTVNWDTGKNHITGMETDREKITRSYHLLIYILHTYKGHLLWSFSILILFLQLIKFMRRGGSWWFAIIGYAFLLLGSAQGGLYSNYIHNYESLDWFSLDATLLKKTGYDFLNLIFIPLMIGFFFSILIEFFRAFSKSVSKVTIEREQTEKRLTAKNLVAEAASLVEILSNNIEAAEIALDKAEIEFREGAFAPFWDAIERALNDLGYFNQGVNKIIEKSNNYKKLIADLYNNPPNFTVSINSLPDARMTSERLHRIVRRAQKDFQFATIYEQRKTNQLLVSGFGGLAQAINNMGYYIEESINNLSDILRDIRETIT